MKNDDSIMIPAIAAAERSAVQPRERHVRQRPDHQSDHDFAQPGEHRDDEQRRSGSDA